MTLGDSMRRVYVDASTSARSVQVQIGRRFCHFKGRFYVIVGFARDHATHDRIVLYRPVDGSATEDPWARLLSDFVADVDSDDGRRVPRFAEAPIELRGHITPEQWREAGCSDRWPTERPLICSVCKQPQHMSVGGVVCPNHHGGAPSEEPIRHLARAGTPRNAACGEQLDDFYACITTDSPRRSTCPACRKAAGL